MPIKGIILVFIIAIVVVATCWEEIYPEISQWFKEEDK